MDEGFLTMLRQTKNNIMKRGSANYYNSNGQYYSFGNQGAFKLVENERVEYAESPMIKYPSAYNLSCI